MVCVSEGGGGNLSASEFLNSDLPAFLTFQVVCQIIKRMAKFGRILANKSTCVCYLIVCSCSPYLLCAGEEGRDELSSSYLKVVSVL